MSVVCGLVVRHWVTPSAEMVSLHAPVTLSANACPKLVAAGATMEATSAAAARHATTRLFVKQ